MEEKELTQQELEMAKEFEQEAKINEQKVVTSEPKSDKITLSDINVNKLDLHLDKNKSFEEQAEDIANAMAVSQATADEKFVDKLAEKKKSTMQDKADTKSNTAKAEKTTSETKKSKADFDLHETVFNAFSIRGHLTEKASKAVLPIFTVLYLFVSLVIGLPFMVIQVVLNNLDGVFCRYESVDAKTKPKVRVTIWILLAVTIVLSIVLGSLAGCGII